MRNCRSLPILATSLGLGAIAFSAIGPVSPAPCALPEDSSTPARALSTPRAATSSAVRTAEVPLAFVENRGQWDPRVRYRAQAGPMSAWILDAGWRLHIARGGGADAEGPEGARGIGIDMRFEGARPAAAPRASQQQRATYHWLTGAERSRHVTGARSFGRLRYEALYDGVDLVLREQDRHIEYDLMLRPGACLSQVVVRCDGMDRLHIEEDGTLVLETALGELRQKPPTTWSVDAAGERQPVACRYVILDERRFGFAVDGWDERSELVIDPGLVWASLLGGTGDDRVLAVFAADNGETCAAGATSSANFPTTVGLAYSGVADDAFVAMFNADGTQLLWVTYLGGNESDCAQAVHVDAAGVTTVAGDTDSTDFPVTSNGFKPTKSGHPGNTDVFVARLDQAGGLLYGTFFGAPPSPMGGSNPGTEELGGMWVDEVSGLVYLTGTTLFPGGFPATASAVQVLTTGRPTFLSILDPSQPGVAGLLYSTHLGGSGGELSCGAPHVDAQGIVTYAGTTASPNFPTTPGAFQTALPGGVSGFVCRIDPGVAGLAGVVYSTYLGSSGAHEVAFEAWGGPGNLVSVAGSTISHNFPTTAGSLQPQRHGHPDAVACQLDPSQAGAAQLVWSTYFGGDGAEEVHGLHVDAQGLITVAGWTGRPLTNVEFPTTPGAFQPRRRLGASAGFVTVFDPQLVGGGGELIYSSFMHGCESARVEALHVDASGVATLGGHIESSTRTHGFPVTRGAAQTRPFGAKEGFVARLELTGLLPAVTSFGASCPGTVGTPVLRVVQPPELCSDYVVQLLNARPGQAGIMIFGASNAFWGAIPLPVSLGFLGMGPCALHVSVDALVPVSTGGGAVNITIPVPLVREFVGGTFYNQIIYADPGANPASLVATNGLAANVRS